MTSTTLDVTLCLLLVSAGAVTVATTRPPAGTPAATDRADHALETLATSTTTVAYAAPAGESSTARTRDGAARTRTPSTRRARNGTIAALLADAAVGDVRAGERATGASRDEAPRGAFEAAVANETRSAVGAVRVQVVARWRPYPGATVGGRVAVGPSPPPGVDVHAAATTVPSGLPAARAAALEAADGGGYTRVARAVASGVVSGLFPPEATALALAGSASRAGRIRARYGRVAAAVGSEAGAPTAASERAVRRANARLADALASRVERTLRRGFESPEAAARAVRVDSVTVVVRTWS
ncbi:MAG: hypothetical protein ABEJ22_06385 [Haloferacaceae archaeon]